MTGIKRYRKKPVEVAGVQYDGDNDIELRDFVGYRAPSGAAANEPSQRDRISNWLPAHHGQGAKVWNTSQGSWNDVNPGDTILRGLVGEYYPCSPDALAATYDGVTPDA